MRFGCLCLAMLAGALACPIAADAHFQVLVPQTDVLDRNAGSVAELSILFTHPMENGPVMPMGKPQSGWWGFAALVDGDQKAKAPDGKMVEVEWGGVLWVRTVPMQQRPDAPRSNADAH